LYASIASKFLQLMQRTGQRLESPRSTMIILSYLLADENFIDGSNCFEPYKQSFIYL